MPHCDCSVADDKRMFFHDSHGFLFNVVYTKKLGLHKPVTQELMYFYLFFENILSMDISPPPEIISASAIPRTRM